jgi:hypothetical protein
MARGEVRGGAGGAAVAPSPDEREEKDLLQLRDGGSKMREPYPSGDG